MMLRVAGSRLPTIHKMMPWMKPKVLNHQIGLRQEMLSGRIGRNGGGSAAQSQSDATANFKTSKFSFTCVLASLQSLNTTCLPPNSILPVKRRRANRPPTPQCKRTNKLSEIPTTILHFALQESADQIHLSHTTVINMPQQSIVGNRGHVV